MTREEFIAAFDNEKIAKKLWSLGYSCRYPYRNKWWRAICGFFNLITGGNTVSDFTRSFINALTGMFGFTLAIVAVWLWREPIGLSRQIGWTVFVLVLLLIFIRTFNRSAKKIAHLEGVIKMRDDDCSKLISKIRRYEEADFARLVKSKGYDIDFSKKIIKVRRKKSGLEIAKDMDELFDHPQAIGDTVPITSHQKVACVSVASGWVFKVGNRRWIAGDVLK